VVILPCSREFDECRQTKSVFHQKDRVLRMRFAGFETLDVECLEVSLVGLIKDFPVCLHCSAVRPEMFELSKSESQSPYWESLRYICPNCVMGHDDQYLLCGYSWFKWEAKVLVHDAFLYRIQVKCRCKKVLEVKYLPFHRRICPLNPLAQTVSS